jgi:hypothetical protein
MSRCKFVFPIVALLGAIALGLPKVPGISLPVISGNFKAPLPPIPSIPTPSLGLPKVPGLSLPSPSCPLD